MIIRKRSRSSSFCSLLSFVFRLLSLIFWERDRRLHRYRHCRRRNLLRHRYSLRGKNRLRNCYRRNFGCCLRVVARKTVERNYFSAWIAGRVAGSVETAVLFVLAQIVVLSAAEQRTVVRVASAVLSVLAAPVASAALSALAALVVNERLGYLRYRKYGSAVLSVRVYPETVALSGSVETAGLAALSVLAVREHLGIVRVVLW